MVSTVITSFLPLRSSWSIGISKLLLIDSGTPSMRHSLTDTLSAPTELAHTLQSRHVTMISFGGIIGAGLFVGSSAAIDVAGPAVVLSYAGSGLLIFLIMRMLGEMAVARPGHGSFAEYAALGLGNWAGFLTGWLYAYFWIITVG